MALSKSGFNLRKAPASGIKEWVGYITLDSDYTQGDGGYLLTPAMFGMRRLIAVFVGNPSGYQSNPIGGAPSTTGIRVKFWKNITEAIEGEDQLSAQKVFVHAFGD